MEISWCELFPNLGCIFYISTYWLLIFSSFVSKENASSESSVNPSQFHIPSDQWDPRNSINPVTFLSNSFLADGLPVSWITGKESFSHCQLFEEAADVFPAKKNPMTTNLWESGVVTLRRIKNTFFNCLPFWKRNRRRKYPSL